jgi:hypothetical protein
MLVTLKMGYCHSKHTKMQLEKRNMFKRPIVNMVTVDNNNALLKIPENRFYVFSLEEEK